MPQRTNSFQRIVAAISSLQLPHTKLEESALVRAKTTGQLREVDVLISVEFGDHILQIGIEVTARRRPADVTWVEQQWAKHQDLPTDKLVLVSRRGFTPDAEVLANLKGVDLLEYRAASKRQTWQLILGRVTSGAVTVVEREATLLRVVYVGKPPDELLESQHRGLLTDPAGAAITTPEKYAWRQFEKLEKPKLPESVTRIEYSVEWFLPGWSLKSPTAGSWPVSRLRFELTECRRVGSARLEEGLIGSTAFVSMESPELGAGFVTIQRPGAEPLACAYHRDRNGRTVYEQTKPLDGFSQTT